MVDDMSRLDEKLIKLINTPKIINSVAPTTYE